MKRRWWLWLGIVLGIGFHLPSAFAASNVYNYQCVHNTQDPLGCVQIDPGSLNVWYHFYDRGGPWRQTALGYPPGNPPVDACVDFGNGGDHIFVATIAYGNGTPTSQDGAQIWYRGWSPGGGWGPWFPGPTPSPPAYFGPFTPGTLSCVVNPINGAQELYVVDANTWDTFAAISSNETAYGNWSVWNVIMINQNKSWNLKCSTFTQDKIGCSDETLQGHIEYRYYNGGAEAEAWNSVDLGVPSNGLASGINVCVNHGNGPDSNFVGVMENWGPGQTAAYRGWSSGGGWGPWFQQIGGFAPVNSQTLSCVINPLDGTQQFYLSNGNEYSTYNFNESNINGWATWYTAF